MSIKIKSVELFNIRSHKHFLFIPESAGITVISGANGAGKSTIVDTIAWVLFGTKPHGVSKTSQIFRKDADFGKDKCYAIVELYIDDRLLKIERKMVTKGGSVECTVTEMKKNDSDNNITEIFLAGPAVSHAQKYIKQTLKIDEKGFLAAILVQQKQVDQLISATPKERTEVIEKLTGISSITRAVSKANEQSNDLKKTVKQITVDPKTLETYYKEKEKLETKIKKNRAEKEIKETKIKELDDELKTIINDYQTNYDIHKKYQKIIESKDKCQRDIENNKNQLDFYDKEKERLKPKELKSFSDKIYYEIENELKNLRSSLQNENFNKTNILDDNEKNNILINKSNKIIDSANSNNIDEAVERKNRFEEKIDDLTIQKNSLHNNIINDNSTISSLDVAINVISQDQGQCPTCLQKVDNPDHAIDVLTKQKESIIKTVQSNKIELQKTERKIIKYNEALDNVEKLIDAFNIVNECEKRIIDNNEKLIEVNANIITLNNKISAVDKQYVNMSILKNNNESYQNLVNDAKKCSDRREDLLKEMSEIEDELKGVVIVSDDTIEELYNQKESIIEDKNVFDKELNNCENNEILYQAELVHLNEKIVVAEEEKRNYDATLKTYSSAVAVHNILKDFRSRRITDSIPVMETYASDLLNRFTEGKFVALNMDQNFNASVVLKDGSKRPVGLLSGGELSATALSLRLSIAILLSSGNSYNPVIFDEVLVSQDSTRSEIILSTIKEVCHGQQIILIAHNDSINSIADKVVELP